MIHMINRIKRTKIYFLSNYDETFSMCGFHIFVDNYETEKNLDKIFPKLFLFFER